MTSPIIAKAPLFPDPPTESHVLAQSEPEETGLAQQADINVDNTETETQLHDLGWSTHSKDNITDSLLGDITNEDLWTLVRRFDKVSIQLRQNYLLWHNANVVILSKSSMYEIPMNQLYPVVWISTLLLMRNSHLINFAQLLSDCT